MEKLTKTEPLVVDPKQLVWTRVGWGDETDDFFAIQLADDDGNLYDLVMDAANRIPLTESLVRYAIRHPNVVANMCEHHQQEYSLNVCNDCQDTTEDAEGQQKSALKLGRQRRGEHIRHLRQQHGLTQKQVADTLEVSSQAVSKWEKGQPMSDTHAENFQQLLHQHSRGIDISRCGWEDAEPAEPSEGEA